MAGPTAIEYGLIAALIAVAGITAMSSIGPKVSYGPAKAAAALEKIHVPATPSWSRGSQGEVQYAYSQKRCFAITVASTPSWKELPCGDIPRNRMVP